MNETKPRPLEAIPVLPPWVRITLVLMALLLIGIFTLAFVIYPYDADGRALTMATHMQLRMPECNFKSMTGGLPCPSCGMTTSFALLVRGDIANSLRANFVGTMLALLWAVMIPWSLLCAFAGRPFVVWFFEPVLTRLVLLFLTLALIRWAFVLGLWFFHY